MSESDEAEKLLNEMFTYHAPGDIEKRQYEALRESAKGFARTIMGNCPK